MSPLFFFVYFMKKLLLLLPVVITFTSLVHADDLANVSLDYCTTTENTLQYQIDPEVETGICYNLSNASTTPVTIKLSFIDGTFTNDQRQNKACLSDTDTENFWKYVTSYDQLVTLKAGETIKKDAKMLYPTGMDGLYHGCIVYSVIEEIKDTTTDTTSFSILMRRAKFIDVIVGDPANIQERGIILEDFTAADWKNLSHNPKIRIYKDDADGTYVVQLKVKNVSAVEQDVAITWVASNLLTYKNTFVETRKILKGEWLTITQKLSGNPSYNLTLKLNITNTPFTFGGQAPVIWITKEQTIIWIWNVITYLTIIGILLFVGVVILLIKDLKKRRRVKKVPTPHKTKKIIKKKK